MFLSRLFGRNRNTNPAAATEARQAKRRKFLSDGKSLFRNRALRLETLEVRSLLTILWVDNRRDSGGTEFTSSGRHAAGVAAGASAGRKPSSAQSTMAASSCCGALAQLDTHQLLVQTATLQSCGNWSQFFGARSKSINMQGNQFGVDARTRVVTPETIMNHSQGAFRHHGSNNTTVEAIVDACQRTIQTCSETVFNGTW